MMLIEPCVLSGRRVRLEPLTMNHLDALWKAGSDPEIWQILSPQITCRDEMEIYIQQALDGQQAKTVLPFATLDLATGKVVGTTRFGNIVPEHRRVEIGWTFITPAFQRTHVNTEAKYLMLRHAFETWDCVRVELKTNRLNTRSQNAMLRIGAKLEGTLRSHMISADGSLRDTVYFSVILPEWSEVKQQLELKMASL